MAVHIAWKENSFFNFASYDSLKAAINHGHVGLYSTCVNRENESSSKQNWNKNEFQVHSLEDAYCQNVVDRSFFPVEDRYHPGYPNCQSLEEYLD